ncbi:AAA family ATPase [Pedobacter terrae]|uniref:AAA family ATPase n=1 Tax=Pedobacter terrae TaxID=405671 RepID=UPI002FF667E0
MLLEFNVTNYRSIGEKQILSLIPAAKQRDFPDNIIQLQGYEALNAVSVYGANGSGKSNVLMAFVLFNEIVRISARLSSTSPLPFEPFMLREGWTQKPTRFEVIFVLNGLRYRYGFEFTTTVQSEWLHRKGPGREVPVFLRENDVIDATSSFKAPAALINGAIDATRDNGLFLSSCDAFNIEEGKEIFRWFDSLKVINGLNDAEQAQQTLEMWDDIEYRAHIIDFMTRMKTGFSNMDILIEDKDDGPTHHSDIKPGLERYNRKKRIPMAYHHIYDWQGKKTTDQIMWRFDAQESAGTNRALQLSGPILWTLLKGGLLIVDELEANLHPIMTLDTINLFLDNTINKNDAQILFATHDTNLLTYAELRRDQIYFAEKNDWESTEIYSLSDFVYVGDTPGVKSRERPDTDKEKRYIEGRYGAIPMLGKLNI